MQNFSNIKIAMLGAAKIGHWGLVKPARKVSGIDLYAVAARDPERARSYAEKYQIPVVHDSYEALLADPDIDAIYNPLPNSLHCEWTIRAIEAGKHVLCEKPFSANADQAQAMCDAAHKNNRVLMEAFHYRFHPMVERMQNAVAKLGKIRRIETNMCVPLYSGKDIRYRYDLAGGACMDVGAYAVNVLRLLAASSIDEELKENPQIEAVQVKFRGKNIDRSMKVDVCWDNGASGRIHFSLFSSTLLKMSIKVIGEKGELNVVNPYLPHIFNRFELRLNEKMVREKVKGEATYTYQLKEFVSRINAGGPYVSDLSDSIENMRMIDAIYEKAGLPLRGLKIN